MSDTVKQLSEGALFADLQTSMTEIFLIEMLGAHGKQKYKRRYDGNVHIQNTIEAELKRRYTPDEIELMLQNGYMREVKLTGGESV